jgi:hypothetical protein
MNATSTSTLTRQHCASCYSYLDILDKQKSTDKYWKNCQRCRDKRNSSNRKKRGLPPIQRAPKRIDHGDHGTSHEINSGYTSHLREAIVPRASALNVATETGVASARAQPMNSTIQHHNLGSKARQPGTEHPRITAGKEFVANAEREARLSGATPNTVGIITKEAKRRVIEEESRRRARRHARNGIPLPIFGSQRKALRKTPVDRAVEALVNTLGIPAHHMATTQPPVAHTITRRASTTETPTGHERTTSISTLECSVCGDNFPLYDFPRLGACSHEPRVCQECLLGWLDQRMASTTWEQIQCPSSGCTNVISHDDVKKYAPAETFIR